MSRYDEAKLPSLKDKIREQAIKAEESEVKEEDGEEKKVIKKRRLSK